MQYTVPDYMEEFKCLAGACPDTCCAGWQIMIDDEALEKYKNVEGGFGNRIKNSINWTEQCFEQYERRCAFLNEENLCDLQIESGEDLLCDTCRTYPHHIEEFEDLREISLSLSCPAVAKLIFENDKRVDFIHSENDEMEDYEDFDYFLFSNLEEARVFLLQLIQNRGVNYRVRMAMVLAFSHDLQNYIKKGRLCDVPELLERYQKPNAQERFAKKLAPYCNRYEDAQRYLEEMFQVFSQLEVLNPQWPAFVAEAKRVLFESNVEQKTEMGTMQEIALRWEQLMVYFVFVYFCGAVYDEDAFAKVKFSIASTMLILALDQANQNIQETARRYAKEIEHSQPNIDAMEWNMNHNPAFFFEKMLVCIMNL